VTLKKPKIKPALYLRDGERYPTEGYFDNLDVEVDRSTDSVLGRAVFPNPSRLLIPGQFVKVVVKSTFAVSALVVPQVALQKDQQGYFVLVVGAANKVEIRRVDAGDQIESFWIVRHGLVEREPVIVQGIQKVRPDMAVNPVSDGS
jgi:membrane fusion protein (multidrug efflux system)